jgi:hypothetical protein
MRQERKGIGSMPFNEVVTVKRDTREFNIRESKAQVSDHCILNGSIPEIGSGVRGEQRNSETPAFPLRPAFLATDDASPLVNVELSSVIPLLWRFNQHSPDKVVILSALASIFV